LPSATEHAEKLLAAIIPDRRDLLDRALRHLDTDHFVDPVHRSMFQLLERYAEVTGAILPRGALDDLLRRGRADAGKLAQFLEVYDLLAGMSADESDFRWSLDQLRELSAERSTREALTHGMEVLTRGVDEKGELFRGHVEARTRVLQRFAEIDRSLSMMEAPEGDMRTEGEDILAEYQAAEAARTSGQFIGVEFGIPALDARLSGIRNGELFLIAGYTSEGKTALICQLAWNAAVNQGRNVVILTTETLRGQVRRRVISRHSCVEAFNIPGGLNSRDIKDGTLNAEQKRQLASVVTDFTRNPGYGSVYIVQVPRNATMSYIESKLVRIQRQFPIELVVMDYLALLKSDRRRQSDREELGNILKEAKQLATTFNDGAGIPFVSPWQVNRTNREIAERTGYYTAQALSETAEASNSPDGIITILAPLDNDKRICKVKMQALKVRDGQKANNIEIQVDYATSRFAAPEDVAGEDYFGSVDLLG
jgi:replicative DNA helicase